MSATDTQAGLLDELESVVDRLTALDAVERSESGVEAVETARRLSAVTDRLAGVRLGRLAVVEDSGVWGLDGSRSARAYLVRTTGCSAARAGSDLKLARGLSRHLPRTRRAVLSGSCSIEHARVLSTYACDTELRRRQLNDPAIGESFLLEQTALAVEPFTTVVSSWAIHVDPEAADAKHRADRERNELYVSPTLGGGDCTGWLSPEVTEAFRTALRAEVGQVRADDTRTPGQRNHDALGSLLNRLLGSGTLGRSNQVRPSLVVHVPFNALLERMRAAGLDPTHPGTGLCDPAVLQGANQPLPRAVLDKLACDSDIMRIVFGPDSQVIDLGRTQRFFTDDLRRALDARDGGCRRPGCDAPPWKCIGHHIVPWLDGGPTSLDNGMLACDPDHDWIHRAQITVTDGPSGAVTFTGPDGRSYGTSYPRGPTGLFP